MIDYFGVGNDEKKKEDLKIIIQSKKYEMIVKSIKFFIKDCLKKELIPLKENIEFSKMKLKVLRIRLEELTNQHIYDYKKNSPFYKVFTSFYDKQEAIDFLLSKIKSNFDDLKKKLDPTNRSISIKDIDD